MCPQAVEGHESRTLIEPVMGETEMRLLRIIAVLTLAVSTLLMASPASAAAPQAVLVASVPLSFDCSSVPTTPLAQAMLRQNGLCRLRSTGTRRYNHGNGQP